MRPRQLIIAAVGVYPKKDCASENRSGRTAVPHSAGRWTHYPAPFH